MSDESQLWAILPTTFKDATGITWKFRPITVQDFIDLESRGITADKILNEMGMVDLINLSYEFLSPDTLPPSLNEYRSLLQEQVLDDALEAWRNCLTNFFPRSQRESIRRFLKEQDRMLQEMQQMQLKMLHQTLANPGLNRSQDSPSTLPDTPASIPDPIPYDNSLSPLTGAHT